MASLRDIRKRIKSVKSTQKITKAMKMVAAAKLRRSQEMVEQSSPYASAIEKLIGSLLGEKEIPELLKQREVKKRVLIVLSSDRGLCGAFNSALFKKVEQDLKKNVPTHVILIGKKANAFFSKRIQNEVTKLSQFWSTFSHTTSCELIHSLKDQFLSKKIDQVDIAFNTFISVMTQKPSVQTILPLTFTKLESQTKYIYEPSKEALLEALLPKALEIAMYRPCLNSLASEFGARMAAMDSASRNAGEMIDSLTLNMNRVRQANITRELVEIISGAAAVN